MKRYSLELILESFARLHLAAEACQCQAEDFNLDDLAPAEAERLRRKARDTLWRELAK